MSKHNAVNKHPDPVLGIFQAYCRLCSKQVGAAKIEDIPKIWNGTIICDECVKDLSEIIQLKRKLK